MGELHVIDLGQFTNNLNCKYYVETGTGICVCLRHALKYKFDKLFSIDIDEEIICSAIESNNDARVTFVNNNSVDGLNEVLPSIPENSSVLFFLDAHFPGADFHKITYEESIRKYKQISMPLLEEIRTIKKQRNIENDVFIIDDWKLYDNTLKYEFPGFEYDYVLDEEKIDRSKNLILSEFDKTHNYEINLRHQGFLILTPR
jgi:hypothetical protein